MISAREKQLRADVRKAMEIDKKLSGITPTGFMRLQEKMGLKPAMERLVIENEWQVGFQRAIKYKFAKDWSVEALIVRFRDLFSALAVACAELRLSIARDAGLLY